MKYEKLFNPALGTRERRFKLFDYIEERGLLWDDLQTIEQEILSGNEELMDFLQNELLVVKTLFKQAMGE